MKKTFAVVLSGCGVYDGSEIGEAMMTLLAIEEAGCAYQMFAPDKKQMHVVNHLTGQPMAEERNVLTPDRIGSDCKGQCQGFEDLRPGRI